jgi:hypothetical protein
MRTAYQLWDIGLEVDTIKVDVKNIVFKGME